MRVADNGSRGDGSTPGPRSAIALVFALISMAAMRTGVADGPPPPAGSPAFQPGDISIGEPIALPFEGPAALPPAAPRGIAGLRQADAEATPPAVPGNGWLGLVVAESETPGRFAVAEVAAGGPAAAGGIAAGDEVRAIDGLPLRNSDEVAQAITAIAPGQKVRLAIGRGERVADVTLEAIPRPQVSRGWGALSDSPSTAIPPPAPVVQAPAPAVPAAAADPSAGRRPAPAGLAAPPLAASLPGPVGPPGGSRESGGRTALGVRTLPIDPDVQARFGLTQASGAYVIGVVGDLPAFKAGVPPGSVIVSLDNRPVRSPAELTQLVTSGPVGRPVSLEYVLPGGTARRADVVLQTLERPLERALIGEVEPLATDVPTLQPQPAGTTARRPLTLLDEPTAAAVRDEVRALRVRLESLERLLDSAGGDSGGRP